MKKIVSLPLALVLCLCLAAPCLAVNDSQAVRWGDHSYLVVDEGMTWTDAQAYCQSLGGHLATITSKEEQEFILEQLESSSKNFYWLGGTDARQEGTWEWVTGETWDYQHWASGEPDNHSGVDGSTQNYLAIILSSGKRWDDVADGGDPGGVRDIKNGGLICEWDNPQDDTPADDTPASDDRTVFQGRTYQVFDEPLTWEAAQAACEAMGGHLVTITSEAEQQMLSELLASSSKNFYWLGGTDARQEGTWEWVTGETWDYQHWASGEPDNHSNVTGGGQNCLAMILSSGKRWDDVGNEGDPGGERDIEKGGYICEWDGIQTSFDSTVSQWASPEMEKAFTMGLIPERLVGNDLTKPITRLEFAAVSVKVYENLAATKALPATRNPFIDCNDTEMLKAYNLGLTNGVSDTQFQPSALLNREQAAAMLTRVFKRATMPGWTLASDGNFPLTYEMPARFVDDQRISGWARDSVYFMAANGIIKGTNENKFMPNNATSEEEALGYANATREQALAIAVRMVEKLSR